MESESIIRNKPPCKSSFYVCWVNMRKRCEKPTHPMYKWYGARGISVCERWQSYVNFCEDMLSSWAPGLWLDRMDNNKGYSPDNCKWVTASQNNRNRRSNRWVDTPEGPMVLAEAAEKFGVKADVIWQRIRLGFSVDRTFSKQDFRRKA